MEVSKITVAWKPGFEGLHKADAKAVAIEIVDIGDSATPAQIVDKARDETTELHKCFEWRDDVAAERYRLTQAREIVRHLVIRETVEPDKTPVRYFYKAESSDGYQQTVLIMRDQNKYQALLSTAMMELRAFQRKYKTLAELDIVFDAIEQLMISS